MLSELDNYFLNQPEPQQSCLLALRQIILSYSDEMAEGFGYKMPQYKYKGKPFCYLWTDKKTNQPYILIVKGSLIHHPDLVQEGKSKMRKLFINPDEDIPLGLIEDVFSSLVPHYSE